MVRLGDALIPEDTGPSWPLFTTLMPALRDRVRDETGITVPGTHFTDGPHLAPSEFEISIAGLAAERASVPTEATDPIVFVVDRLEVSLRRRLEQFVTLDDAMELLAGAADGGGALPADRAGKLRVAAIMRALAADRVPLTKLDVVRRAAERSASAMAAAEALRLELLTELPGSDAEQLLELPEGLARRIDDVFDLDARHAAGGGIAARGLPDRGGARDMGRRRRHKIVRARRPRRARTRRAAARAQARTRHAGAEPERGRAGGQVGRGREGIACLTGPRSSQ